MKQPKWGNRGTGMEVAVLEYQILSLQKFLFIIWQVLGRMAFRKQVNHFSVGSMGPVSKVIASLYPILF